MREDQKSAARVCLADIAAPWMLLRARVLLAPSGVFMAAGAGRRVGVRDDQRQMVAARVVVAVREQLGHVEQVLVQRPGRDEGQRRVGIHVDVVTDRHDVSATGPALRIGYRRDRVLAAVRGHRDLVTGDQRDGTHNRRTGGGSCGRGWGRRSGVGRRGRSRWPSAPPARRRRLSTRVCGTEAYAREPHELDGQKSLAVSHPFASL